MRKDNNMIIQLQRYYALWKECTAMYEEWSKDQGLSSNGVFALYSFYESNGRCTQKMISEKWNIPKQTVNTILKDFQKKGYINMVSDNTYYYKKPPACSNKFFCPFSFLFCCIN